MVGYYQAYKGSTQTPLIYHGDKLVKKVYHGSNLVYQIGFAPITYQAGTSLQTFTVPLAVNKIHIDCVASSGYNYGGKGGRVECDLDVTAGDVLYITVGGIPTTIGYSSYNASDIRKGGTDYSNRIIVAGGGGNGIGNNGGWSTIGGDGGGLIGGNSGQASLQYPAYGGTQSEGGARSRPSGGDVYEAYYGTNGALGLGGNGGFRGGAVGGAGGAGLYGGGGGGAFVYSAVGATGSGGGGGSSYTNADCSNVVHTQGFNSGAGYITISMVE